MLSSDVLARFRDGLLLADALRQAERPDGLTMSYLGRCRSEAVRILRNEPQGPEPDDRWPAIRGGIMHDGIEAACAKFGAGTVEVERRVSWQPWPDIPPITGQFDIAWLDEGTVIDLKTSDKATCRAIARNPHREPGYFMQLGGLAAALGAERKITQAFAVLVPVDGTWRDWQCFEVDIPYWSREAAGWYREVWEAAHDGGDVDDVPRDVGWDAATCLERCVFAEDRVLPDGQVIPGCRSGFVHLEQITEPLMQQAAWGLYDARKREKEAKADAAAEKVALGRAHGMVPGEPFDLRVLWVDVKETEDRAAHSKVRLDLLDSDGRVVKGEG